MQRLADPKVLILVAMEAEAHPIKRALAIPDTTTQLHPAFPSSIASREDGRVAVAVNGVDGRFGVDSIASQPAVITAFHAIEQFRPSLVISAGTAGGFSARGGAIGTIVVADRVLFHDRRVALPRFDEYGRGDYPVRDVFDEVVAATNDATNDATYTVISGAVSTGNALDAPAVDLVEMDASQAQAKDMEAAAVAWVCEQMAVDFAAIKAITDLVDTNEDTGEQFASNLQLATANLADALRRVMPRLT